MTDSAKIIAVTGPMAAGKNYICNQLKEEGWAAVDADILVHDAIELVKDKILKTFIFPTLIMIAAYFSER